MRLPKTKQRKLPGASSSKKLSQHFSYLLLKLLSYGDGSSRAKLSLFAVGLAAR